MQTLKKGCAVEGCNGQTRGKTFCGKHMRMKKVPVAITSAVRLTMKSSCCKAACEPGKRHEYGEQYCAKCHEACQWKIVA